MTTGSGGGGEVPGPQKPWILHFNSRGDTIQIDQDEYEALMSDLKEEKVGATLKDGSYINLRIASIVSNPHYVSPESIEKKRKEKTLLEEYRFLKKQGTIKTPDDYIKWKKMSIKNIENFKKSFNIKH